MLKYTKYKSGYIRGTPQGFCDSSGHGVGLEIHVKPSVSKKIALKAGKMITIEPGICFGGIGGVRMEDVVFVRAKGFEFLAPRKLGWSL